jgi:hypothetical protein
MAKVMSATNGQQCGACRSANLILYTVIASRLGFAVC